MPRSIVIRRTLAQVNIPMAVKKATSRTRSTAKKQAKTTRTATKRAPRARSAAKPAAPVYEPPTIEVAEQVAEQFAEEVTKQVPEQVPERAKPRAAERSPEPVISGDRPSRYTADHYLHAKAPERDEGTPGKPGKWLIFVSRTRVDALWDAIRRGVERGRLGHAAKVSTALPDPLSPDPKKHMICVYTPNEDDAADVRRVRAALRGMGVTWKIPYKSDAPARAGQYEGMAGPAAKYYE